MVRDVDSFMLVLVLVLVLCVCRILSSVMREFPGIPARLITSRDPVMP